MYLEYLALVFTYQILQYNLYPENPITEIPENHRQILNASQSFRLRVLSLIISGKFFAKVTQYFYLIYLQSCNLI